MRHRIRSRGPAVNLELVSRHRGTQNYGQTIPEEQCSQCKAHEDNDLAYTRGLGEGILKGPWGGAPEAENWRGIGVGTFNWLQRSCPPFSGGEKVKGVSAAFTGQRPGENRGVGGVKVGERLSLCREVRVHPGGQQAG